jgi:hypothetical protein
MPAWMSDESGSLTPSVMRTCDFATVGTASLHRVFAANRSILPAFVFQIMHSPCQFSESTRLDSIFPIFKVSYRTLGNAGHAGEEFGRKLFGSCSNLIKVFGIHYSFVFPKNLVRGVQNSRFGHHGQVGAARPAGGCFSTNVMKLTRSNVSAHKETDSLASACAAVGRAELRSPGETSPREQIIIKRDGGF